MIGGMDTAQQTQAADPTVPRRRLTEDDWLACMEDFKAGLSDAACGLKWGVTGGAVARQRFNRGIRREDHATPRKRMAIPVPAAPPPAPGKRRKSRKLDVAVADPQAAMRTLMGYSLTLAAEEDYARALAVARLTRSQALGYRALRDVGGGFGVEAAPGAGLPPRPVLHEGQRVPEGDWKTWLFLGGRGAGKTLAGAAFIAHAARTHERLALIGPSFAAVREVMVEGPAGLRGLGSAFGPEGGLPVYEPSRRRLVWPNGAVAEAFSAEDVDGLRGPQFAAAWADEACAWPRLDQALAMARMGLRLGDRPRLVITTTPRPGKALRTLLAEPNLVVSRGSAVENAANMAPGFVERLRDLYGGTRLERQEIDGEVLEALEGAIFRRAEIERARALYEDWGRAASFDRIAVAVDPPAGMAGSACGIVATGRAGVHAVVLQDKTVHGLTPFGWARRVVELAKSLSERAPVVVVAEANQGGEMVRDVLTSAGLTQPVTMVHARSGKAARAEPVSLLYEQGRVAHAPGLEALEDQMLLLGAEGPEAAGVGADRVDALVWALSALMLGGEGPRIRSLG
jgi:phage terminase large subunit-like protein